MDIHGRGHPRRRGDPPPRVEGPCLRPSDIVWSVVTTARRPAPRSMATRSSLRASSDRPGRVPSRHEGARSPNAFRRDSRFRGAPEAVRGPTASGKDLPAPTRRPPRSTSSSRRTGRRRGSWRPGSARGTPRCRRRIGARWRRRRRRSSVDQSKDLEVCAYLIEALVRMHGFAGMRDGYRLARAGRAVLGRRALPLPGEADVERRCADLLQLNGIDATGALVPPHRPDPLHRGDLAGAVLRVQLQEAQALAKIADPKARQAKIDNGASRTRRSSGPWPRPGPSSTRPCSRTPPSPRRSSNGSTRRLSGSRAGTRRRRVQYDPPSGNIQEVVQGTWISSRS